MAVDSGLELQEVTEWLLG